MSIIFDVLKELYDVELNCKGYRVNIFGIPSFKKYNSNSLKASVFRLRKEGYINGKSDSWNITSSGKKYFNNKKIY